MKMNSKKNELDEFDDYFEEEEDFLSTSIDVDYSDVGYEDFNKVKEVEEYEEGEEEVVEDNKKVESTKEVKTYSFIDYLNIFWTWFRRLGIVIAIILSAYYVTKGMFLDLFYYILLLVGGFCFGFGFMFALDKYMDKK